MRMLDLYCGAGGASVGYSRAGFKMMGIDLADMPNYPFMFARGNALTALVGVIDDAGAFDAIHASPPCQASTALTKGTNRGRQYVDLIPATRALLDLTGLPYVIENVQGAAIRPDLTLCGEMFGLGVIRHRRFELGGWTATQPTHKPHRGKVRGWRHGKYFDGPYLAVYGDGGGKGSVAEWQAAMGVPWMTERKEIAESIPPAMTEYVGTQLMQHLEMRAAA
jgi:hypothetical protein